MSGQYREDWGRQMTQQGFVLADWVQTLSARLGDLVNYERSLEHVLSDLRLRDELMLGLSGHTHGDFTVNIRERVGLYSMILRREPPHDSTYQRGVSTPAVRPGGPQLRRLVSGGPSRATDNPVLAERLRPRVGRYSVRSQGRPLGRGRGAVGSSQSPIRQDTRRDAGEAAAVQGGQTTRRAAA